MAIKINNGLFFCLIIIILASCSLQIHEQTDSNTTQLHAYFSNWAVNGNSPSESVSNTNVKLVFPTSINSNSNKHNASQALNKNFQKMKTSDFFIVNITPNGTNPSLNVITAFEIGYMFALDKPIIAYTHDSRLLTQRTIDYVHSKGDKTSLNNTGMQDGDGNNIESFELVDNLMIDGAIMRSGGTIEKDLKTAIASKINEINNKLANQLILKPQILPIHQTKNNPIEIYMAGPDVFYPNALEISNKNKIISQKLGFKGNFPFDNELSLSGTPKQNGLEIFDANIKLMRQSDIISANMSPFRGQYMDPGTAFEIGFMLALGRQTIGYREETTEKTSIQRMLIEVALTLKKPEKTYRKALQTYQSNLLEK